MNERFASVHSSNIKEFCEQCGMRRFPNWPHRCMFVKSTNPNVTPVYETELPVPDFMKSSFSES
jgi:hypothetical protein